MRARCVLATLWHPCQPQTVPAWRCSAHIDWCLEGFVNHPRPPRHACHDWGYTHGWRISNRDQGQTWPPSLANALDNTYWLALFSPPPDARPLRAISMQTPGEPNRRGDPLASALLASPLPPPPLHSPGRAAGTAPRRVTEFQKSRERRWDNSVLGGLLEERGGII